jgi:hypothetical protein
LDKPVHHLFDEQHLDGVRAAALRSTFSLPAGPLGPLLNPVKPGAILNAEAYIPGQQKMVKPWDRPAPRLTNELSGDPPASPE